MSQKQKFIALLRGINVGGNNIIKMTDLTRYFETMGFTNVKTYIQSGNVLFESSISTEAELEQIIETGLNDMYGKRIKTLVISQSTLSNVINRAPKEFETDSRMYKYDVIFVKSPLTAKVVFESLEVTPEVDQIWLGDQVVYFSRVSEMVTKSSLHKLVQNKMYMHITIRNWRTTKTLNTMINQ